VPVKSKFAGSAVKPTESEFGSLLTAALEPAEQPETTSSSANAVT
jgi:hypothetical protein